MPRKFAVRATANDQPAIAEAQLASAPDKQAPAAAPLDMPTHDRAMSDCGRAAN